MINHFSLSARSLAAFPLFHCTIDRRSAVVLLSLWNMQNRQGATRTHIKRRKREPRGKFPSLSLISGENHWSRTKRGGDRREQEGLGKGQPAETEGKGRVNFFLKRPLWFWRILIRRPLLQLQPKKALSFTLSAISAGCRSVAGQEGEHDTHARTCAPASTVKTLFYTAMKPPKGSFTLQKVSA